MAVSRTERRERLKAGRTRLWLAVGLIVFGVVALGTVAAIALTRGGPDEDGQVAQPVLTETVEAVATAPVPVEVPDVTGDPLAQAEMVLAYAGFEVERAEVPTVTADPDRAVLQQEPIPGVQAERGGLVTLYYGSGAAKASTITAAAEPDWQYIVCIDPGHQQRSDQRPEPVGPGSQQTKMRVTGGATGVSTGRPEYVFTLELAQRVRKRLEAAGVQVVMTRTKHDVSISNAERAKVANKAGAELFLRIHADGSTDRSIHGISTLYPARNMWTAPIVARSQRAAQAVHASVLVSTGAADRGTHARGDLSGFNWCEVPAILVECGYLSNAAEDELMATPAYQEKLAAGIAQGVLTYLKEE